MTAISAAGPLAGPIWAGAATLAAPALRALLRMRAARGKELLSRLGERRGIERAPRPTGRLIWLHAASVGETMSILPVLPPLAAAGVTVLITTGTVTSAELLAQRLPPLGLGARVLHRFVPLDVPAWVARFLDHWRPDVAGFVESELWPNLLAACRTRAIPSLLINARMSARSFAAWSRVPWAARLVLDGFAGIRARGEEDATRLRSLGAPGVEVAGDLKLAAPALPADPAVLAGLRERLGERPVWCAASTHPGEETVIQAAHARLVIDHPGLVTIVVPRHPERGPELAATLAAPRRGLKQAPPEGGIWIADTMGEMGLWYRLCPIVLIGRGLIAPGGGQNPLEPARLGCAIATGPYTDNFREHVALLRGANALTVVRDVAGIADFVSTMLNAPEERRAMGERARAAVQAPDTLAEDTAQALLGLMKQA